MAYNLKQISPLDLKPSTAIGVKLPFKAANVFTSVYTTKEQIKYNLINFLLTDRNERPFNPNFGAGLRSYLFEQITNDSLDSLEASIRSKIEDNFPTVNIKTLTVTGDPNYSSINIRFSYTLINTNENDSVIITIQNS
jgi:phage baseplate assembly protein W